MKTFMAVLVANAVMMTDGDAAFLRVNNRDPAHALTPGTVAAATNCRFENGKPRPRYGVAVDGWGTPVIENLIDAGDRYDTSGGNYNTNISGFVIGQTYTFIIGNASQLFLNPIFPDPVSTYTTSATFVATATTYRLGYGGALPPPPTGPVITARITTIRRDAATLAYKRFSDPDTDTDNCVLVTDEWRTTGDGGRGKAWRIYPGNVPVEIPLNGHDIWETARLVQCDNALLMLRSGNERHYFIPADCVDPTNDRITLHCAPSWTVGTAKRVLFQVGETGSVFTGANIAVTNSVAAADTIATTTTSLVTGDAFLVTLSTDLTAGAIKYINVVSAGVVSLYDTKANAIIGGAGGKFNITVNSQTGSLTETGVVPAAGSYYYAKHVSSGIIELYSDVGLAASSKVGYSGATTITGKFYIELAAGSLPYFTEGAPVLLMQPDGEGLNAFENGFKATTPNVVINGTVAATDVMTARNHRFTPGDSVTGTDITGVGAVPISWPKFAAPQSDHTLRLYDSEDFALADNGVIGPDGGLVDLTVDAETGTIWLTNSSALTIPPLREGIYYKGRLIGFNGPANLVIGDPGDFLHFEQFKGTVPANFGEAGRGVGMLQIGEDALLIIKEHSIYVATGLSGDSSGWRLDDVTKEFGGLSPLAMLNVGTDGWIWTRKGVASIIRTISGDKQAVVDTVSDAIPQDLADVYWSRANLACAEIWNGRYFLAVAGRGQDVPVNNKVFVYNFKNQNLTLEQSEAIGEVVGRVVRGNRQDAWEGTWEGDLLTPYAFAKLNVNGEERLTFATPDGVVCWLHDGWDDAGAAITSEILTRGYFGGREMLVLKGNIQWDSFNPKITANILTRGVNEEETLAGFDELQYDNTHYLTADTSDYDPDSSTVDQFNAPYREDYSPADGDLSVATLDLHQNLSEPYRCRVRGSAPQLRITNEQGSLRVCSVSVQGRPVGISATRKV
jgi:hypothetical protein